MNVKIKQAYSTKSVVTGKIVKKVFLPLSRLHAELIDQHTQQYFTGLFCNFIVTKISEENIVVAKAFTMEEQRVFHVPKRKDPFSYLEEEFLNYQFVCNE